MPKVLISDKLSPRAADIFKQNGIEVDVKVGMNPDELKACIGEYHGLAIRSATKVTKEILDAATNLKVVGRAGIGVDNVAIPEATARGVIVMNTPFGNSVTTAEHAIAMMFAVARKIPQANASTHAGKWEKSSFMGVELAFKTLGLIGCGNIGSIVADRAHGLKMKVVVYDPFLTEERAKEINVEKVDLDTLLARADFITLHTPLNEGTRNILDADAFAKIKKGVRIVNCARGGLIDESALKDAIEAGQVAGAALDVFAEEPAKENVLFGVDAVICTPHLGASTSEAQENVAIQVAEQMSDYLNNGTVTNSINVPSVSSEDAAKLNPYITLGDQLGGFIGQVVESGIKDITIEYQGSVANLNTKPITASILKGLLTPMVETANVVNAPVLAKERNIDIKEVHHAKENSDYQTQICLTVKTDTQERTVCGTLFGGSFPRVVSVNDVKLEAGLSEHVIYVKNADEPGLIGNIGTLLSDKKVNIANFTLGRNSQKTDAIALVEIDQAIDAETLKTISNLPSVKEAKLLKF